MAFSETLPRLPVRDLPRAIGFYTDRLGFEVGTLWPDEHPTFCILRSPGGARVSFFIPESGDIAHTSPPPQLSFEMRGGAAALADDLARHMRLEWGPEVYWYGRREFAILDPEGYLIIFSEETGDPPACLPG